MHILILPSWFPQKEDPLLGIFFQEQARALIRQGLEVRALYPEVRPLKNLSPPLFLANRFQTSWDFSSVPTLRLHGWNLFPKMIKAQMHAWVYYAKKLFRDYINYFGKPDLIHAHSFLWGGLAASSIHKKWGVPFIVTEHRNHFIDRIALSNEITSCWTYPYIAKAVALSHGIIGVTPKLTEVLREYGEGQYHTIANSVDTDFFKPGEKTGYQFITVQHLEERKNIPMLFRAFKRILALKPEASLVVLGEGPERKNLENLAQELGISHKIAMPGTVSRETVRDQLQKSRAFLFSSNSESFGVALIEAFAAGLPVLSTRCGGPEAFMNDDVGILVPKQDEEAFFQGFKSLISRDFDEKAICNYAKNFHEERVALKYKALYEGLC